MAEESVPRWKRDLIERRRRTASVHSVGPLRVTCPGVVTAVRHPVLSKGMRLPTTVPDIQHLIDQIEENRKMGEEKTKKLSPSESGLNPDCGDEANLSDSSEEFKYGPGIVSKLKNKYLSLTLRESHAKVRPSLASMRRATSLENILDEEPTNETKQPKFIKNVSPTLNVPAQSRRSISRSKENMKRARSVEALMRYNRSVSLESEKEEDVREFTLTDEEKSRNRASLEERELPPPDLVKQTLKLFEPCGVTVSKPPPPPKIPATLKVTSQKPVISPKPLNSVENKDKILNGQTDVRVDTKIRFRPNDLGSPGPESPRLFRDSIKVPAAAEIIEKERSKTSHEKSVINKTNDDKFRNDDVDTYRPKSLFTKDWTSTKDRFENKDHRAIIMSDRPVLKDVITDNSERPPTLPDRSPPLKDRPPFFPERGSPNLELKNFREFEPPEKQSIPSPKPRTLPTRVADKKPTVAPPPPPESRRSLSPVTVRPVPETVSSPVSPQMKQVGVIRPIVTQKSIQHQSPKSHSDRELEKNLLNKVKSVEQPVTKVIVSLKQSPEECTVVPPKISEEKKVTSWSQKPNTMVFNFRHRKDVPDYIENDGLILGKRERPKIGDSGMILLPGATDDFSTDFDGEELTTPCDIVFIGDNVLINGKSNLQKVPKRTKVHIKFNEEAPELYEYPSEASLLDDLTISNADTTTTSPGLNLPLKSTSLASYTPSKVAIDTDFQLGITKSQPIAPASSSSRPSEILSSDEEDYLRPVDDASTVAWSSDTAADLLF